MTAPPSLDAISLLGHQLRRPLTVIRGAASLLLESDERLSPDRRQQMLRLIDSSSAAMSQLIEDLLLAWHLEAGSLDLELEPVSTRGLAEAALAAVGADAEARVQLLLPEPDPLLRADLARGAIALRALLDNALRLSSAGVAVELAAVVADASVRLEVRDRGPGLPLDQVNLAFQRFGQLETGGAGLGLGLYLARELARRMQGEVGVEPRPDGGSVFWFRLARHV